MERRKVSMRFGTVEADKNIERVVQNSSSPGSGGTIAEFIEFRHNTTATSESYTVGKSIEDNLLKEIHIYLGNVLSSITQGTIYDLCSVPTGAKLISSYGSVNTGNFIGVDPNMYQGKSGSVGVWIDNSEHKVKFQSNINLTINKQNSHIYVRYIVD